MSTVRENNLFFITYERWSSHLTGSAIKNLCASNYALNLDTIYISLVSFLFLSPITTEIFKWPVFDISPCIYMVQRVHVTNDTETQPSKRLRVVFRTSGKKGRRETILRYRLYYVSWFQDFYPRFCFTISSDTRAFHLLYGCSPHTFADFMPPFLPKSLYRM